MNDPNIIGKVIKGVRLLTQKEYEKEGWNQSVAAIVLDDNSIIYAASDFEGNDGGALVWTVKNQSYDIYPFKN